jgi:hypothetical protein
MCFTAFGVHHSTVQTLLSRLERLDTTNERPCSRRPCVTTARQNRNMRLTRLRHPLQTAVVQTAATTAGSHNKICARTVHSSLREVGA